MEEDMKIIIGVDGSKQSDAAIVACGKFIKSATQIKIISVVEQNYTMATEPFAVSAEFYSEVAANEKKLAEERVEKSKNNLIDVLNDKGIQITAEVFLGNPSRVIVEEAENWKADLIIVGSHGYGFWQRALIGSVSDSIIHHAPCSVLVVK
jgi:nucleotide-binding universal stress UspA family protein